MPIFPHIDLETSVQLNDRTRFDVSKCYSTANETEFTALKVQPTADSVLITAFSDVVKDRFLDWEFLVWAQDIDITMNKIQFNEGGSNLTATLTSGTYTKTDLATEIQTQLNAAGAHNYTVSFDELEKLTISADGVFDLVIDGTERLNLLPLISFFDQTALTGKTSYTSNRVEYLVRKVTVYAGQDKTNVQTIVTSANTSHALNNKYFFISTAGDAIQYYVWFNSSTTGTDPGLTGLTGVQVAITNNDTAAQVATALASALDALAGFIASASTTTVTVTNATIGWCTAAYDNNTGFTFATMTEGQTQATDTRYVNVYTVLGDGLFCTDEELEVEEPDILHWVKPGRNTYKDVHRQVQTKIIEYLDRNGFVNELEEKFTKNDIKDISEVREWARYMALRLIFEGIKNASADVFEDKRKYYDSQETVARQRVVIRLDTDKDGVVNPWEEADGNSISLLMR